MEAGARRTGLTAWEIAERYTADFQEKLEWLNVLTPHVWCRATDHICEQIAAIAAIEEKGYAYRTDDGLYFDTSRLSDYGHLARLDIEGLQGGQRVDLGQKRRVTDFALWKFSPEETQRQMEWDSPWGRGFPGWHIECTAMAAKYLGPHFDIHCGGRGSHPGPSYQRDCPSPSLLRHAAGRILAPRRFLQLDGEKMSKSSGDFLRLESLIEEGYDPLAYRFSASGRATESNSRLAGRASPARPRPSTGCAQPPTPGGPV